MSGYLRRLALLVLSLPSAHSLEHTIRWAQTKPGGLLLTFEFARSNCTDADASIQKNSFYPTLRVSFKCFKDRPKMKYALRLTDEVQERATVRRRRGALEVTLQKQKEAMWKDLLSMKTPAGFRIERDWKRGDAEDDDELEDDDDDDDDKVRKKSRAAKRRAAEAFHKTGVREQTFSAASVTSSGGVDVMSAPLEPTPSTPQERAKADADAYADSVSAMPKSASEALLDPSTPGDLALPLAFSQRASLLLTQRSPGRRRPLRRGGRGADHHRIRGARERQAEDSK